MTGIQWEGQEDPALAQSIPDGDVWRDPETLSVRTRVDGEWQVVPPPIVARENIERIGL